MRLVARAAWLLLLLSAPDAILAHQGAPLSVEAVLSEVSEDSLMGYITRLVAFDTRYMTSDSNAAAVTWMQERLVSLEFEEVRLDSFDLNVDRLVAGFQWVHSGARQVNVIATHRGVLYPDRRIVIGAHYDTISLDRTPSSQDYAPGADDNASGVAALLEIARVISDLQLDSTIEFALFGSEELGLIGSAARAEAARTADEDIIVMIQLDAIGTESTQIPGAFSIDTIGPYASFGERVAEAARVYTPVRVRNTVGGTVSLTNTGCRCSDHQSFIDRGFPAIGIFQYDGNSFAHLNTSDDTIDRVSVSLVGGITRATLAAVLDIAGYPVRTPDFDASGLVDFTDFVAFAERFGLTDLSSADEPYDLDRDGAIGFSDFILFADRFGSML